MIITFAKLWFDDEKIVPQELTTRVELSPDTITKQYKLIKIYKWYNNSIIICFICKSIQAKIACPISDLGIYIEFECLCKDFVDLMRKASLQF